MTNIEKKLLKDLYESTDGLFLFTFYSRYKIEPDKIYKFVEKYESKGIINLISDKLTITKIGRDILLKQIFHKASNSDNKLNIPEEFVIDKISINEPFLPNIKEVSKEILMSPI